MCFKAFHTPFLDLVPGMLPSNSYLPYKTQLLMPSGRRCMPGSFCPQSFSPSPTYCHLPQWSPPSSSPPPLPFFLVGSH